MKAFARTDRYLIAAATLVAVLALGATGWILALKLGENETMAGPGLVVMTSGVGGPFALVDHRGRAVTEADFAASPALIYFGYSFCPDICPTTLQTMAAALDSDAARAKGATGLFITVDPERDTVAQLADYVPLFHPDLVGLTGSEDTIERAARGFRVYYKLRKDIDPESYPVDHSSYVYLMDRGWRLVGVFRHDATAEDMAAAIKRLS
ncbi:MAG: SCO family protein [Alphaproteobacteria bacterium]